LQVSAQTTIGDIHTSVKWRVVINLLRFLSPLVEEVSVTTPPQE